MEILQTIIVFIIAHFAIDYQFQSESVAIGKNRKIDNAQYGVNWWYWMTSHAATHGMAIFLITGNVAAGLCETIFHFAIDTGKCEGKYGLHVDQCLHMISKVLLMWIVL